MSFEDTTVLSSDLMTPTSTVDSPTRRSPWIILPVSIPGTNCSEIMIALSHLFGFGRVVSATQAFSTEMFVSSVIEMLDETPVVIADRSNHTTQHRAAFRAQLLGTSPSPRILALHWDISSLPMSEIESFCLNGSRRTAESRAAILGCVNEYEALQPVEVDLCIDLDTAEGFAATFLRAATGVAETLRLEMPAALHDICRTPMQRRLLDTIGARFLTNCLPISRRLDRHRVLVPSDVTLGHRHVDMSGSSVLLAASALSSCPKEISHLDEVTALVDTMRCNPMVRAKSLNTGYGHCITIWTIPKRAFYRFPPALPTFARSLWTTPCAPAPGGSANMCVPHRIVFRGYDKIYGVDEVPWSTWKSLAAYLNGPFHVTAKLNGSLIMVSAVAPRQLLVSSRGSLRAQTCRESQHADIGETWLLKQLKRANKSPEALADLLWCNNWTLMCELLDDAFEERVMPVPQTRVGLHLHGINVRTVTFSTESPECVAAFAIEWGLFPVVHETFSSLDEVQGLVNDHTNSASWRGIPVEGVVVRGTVGASVGNVSPGPLFMPYPPPHDAGYPFFFKVYFNRYKFYHGMRMITLAALNGQAITLAHPLSKILLARSELKAFETWISAQIASQAILLDRSKRRGFISIRTRFLTWFYTPQGMECWTEAIGQVRELETRAAQTPPFLKAVEYGIDHKWLFLFLGLPGCGKTSIARALSILFGFKHIESGTGSARSAKKAKAQFDQAIGPAFKNNSVVLADGNCHRASRRQRIFDAMPSITPEPKVLVFDWKMTTDNIAMAQRVSSWRIKERNMATLCSTSDRTVRCFSAEYEAIEDHEADAVILMRYEDDMEEALNRAVDGVIERLGIRRPSPHDIRAAVRCAGLGASSLREEMPSKVDQGSRPMCHYALLPEIDVVTLLDRAVNQSTSGLLSTTWKDTLVSARSEPRLIYTQPHITLVHPKRSLLSPVETRDLLLHCAMVPATMLFEVSLGKLIFNSRIIVATVETIGSDPEDPSAFDLASRLPKTILAGLHVVLARRHPLVAPHEGIAMIQAFEHGAKGIYSFPLDICVHVPARLQGLPSS